MMQYSNGYTPSSSTSDYPFAPVEWCESDARRMAAEEGIEITSDHLEVLRALQKYIYLHPKRDLNARELHDALNEKFHQKGGIRYLYVLFPGGPIAQGCRLAGLPVPTGAVDRSFGSVQ